MSYVTPTTMATGHKVTAAEWNQDVRDNVSEVYTRVNTKVWPINCVFEDEVLVVNSSVPVKTITIPIELNGAVLINADAVLYTPSTSGAVTVRLWNFNTAANVCAAITIDQDEYTSYTAASQPVINALYDDVSTGDRIGFLVDGIGAGSKGLDVILTFMAAA